MEPPNELTDSDNETQEQAYSMIMIKPKPKKHYSPRSMNKMLVGYTRHDHKDATCNRERAAAEERVSSSDEVEARMSINGSLQENLFGDNQAQDLLQVRDAMNAQDGVSEQSMDASNTCEQCHEEDDTRADAPVEHQATDQEGSIIDETLNLSTVKDRTRSKSKKYGIQSPIVPNDSEDEMPRPSRRKRAQRGASVSSTGVTAKFLRRNSNQFSSTASIKLNARRGWADCSESE